MKQQGLSAPGQLEEKHWALLAGVHTGIALWENNGTRHLEMVLEKGFLLFEALKWGEGRWRWGGREFNLKEKVQNYNTK